MDDELKLQDFKKAAEVLADVWTDHVIDNHPVTAVASFDQDNADATYPAKSVYGIMYVRHNICCKYGSAQTDYQ